MVFEMIQPDFEINRRHAATFQIPIQAKVCEPLRAALGEAGKFWRRRSGSPAWATTPGGVALLLLLW